MEDNTIHSTKQLFPQKTHNKPRSTTATQKNQQKLGKDKNKNKKWAVFTYHSPKIRKLTNLIKHTNIGIAFRSTNTIQQRTKPKISNNTQNHNMSGMCKLM
jgi:hypothetical protein